MARTRSLTRPSVLPRMVVTPVILFWLTAGTAANLLLFASPAATTAIALLGLAHSMVGWLAHGGRRVSIPGVYLLSVALFVYFPALYLNSDPVMGPLPELIDTVNICYFGQIAAYYFWWKPADVVAPAATVELDEQATRQAMWAGFLLVAIGLAANLIGFNHFLFDSVTFSGTVLYAVAAFSRPKATMLGSYVVVAGMFAIYYLIIFEGFGRLTLGALVIAIVATMAHRWRGRAVKIALVASMAPAVMFLARNRVQFTATLNPDQSSEVTGLESVLSPLGRFAQLIGMERAGILDHGNGSSFGASAVALLPRALWEDKPIGFGAELTLLFRPELAATIHSEAATFHGEWLYNFGFWGLAFMLPVVAFVVGRLDRVLVTRQARPLTDIRHFIAVAALVILGAGMTDLIWGGSFTFMSRGGSRILVLLALYGAVAWMPRSETSQNDWRPKGGPLYHVLTARGPGAGGRRLSASRSSRTEPLMQSNCDAQGVPCGRESG